MVQASPRGERRTSVDEVFEFLQEEISSMRLRPGDKISEADVANRFGVSRQPVRDAFSRLANLDLLLIRPQRATEVKRFSMREIEKSRFVRTAVEKEALRRASEFCDEVGAAQLDAELAQQKVALKKQDLEEFGRLDYAFHETLCKIAKAEFAFDVIMAEKSKVDRLCMLSLAKADRMVDLVEDHTEIAEAVKNHDAESALAAAQKHLSRLDKTIERITETNAHYFEPELV
ncbi:GntR family transcriptional regulator [Halocynthiibacter sp. C4]|uniref:GntR family transcriptional regulator n=1 Tax=Halocynthiibacter sp. C4 TaxID=2992758 RepID=UPI00237AD931|nr:GntR family transcriptional regulator [Halocynthiibacter sp. C4]MDE0589961.1 GntR family transcriptional regulator [Halocynthiibacter sp. C4]